MKRVLTLDAAMDGCSAGLLIDGLVVGEMFGPDGRGQSAVLPVLARSVLSAQVASSLDLIAVTIGPGSFTGIRTALALAHGVGLAAGVHVVGVTTGAALAANLPPVEGCDVWVAIASRRGRVFLERGGEVGSFDLAELPWPAGPVVLLGDAALSVASRLTERGAIVRLADPRRPCAAGIAHAAHWTPRLAQPLYVDPARTTLVERI